MALIETHQSEMEQKQRQRPSHEDIAALAYALWLERGCPEGSPETDWFEAERRAAGEVPAKTDSI